MDASASFVRLDPNGSFRIWGVINGFPLITECTCPCPSLAQATYLTCSYGSL